MNPSHGLPQLPNDEFVLFLLAKKEECLDRVWSEDDLGFAKKGAEFEKKEFSKVKSKVKAGVAKPCKWAEAQHKKNMKRKLEEGGEGEGEREARQATAAAAAGGGGGVKKRGAVAMPGGVLPRATAAVEEMAEEEDKE